MHVFLSVHPVPFFNTGFRIALNWRSIPVSAMISFFLLGIEELSIQLEEPFSVLPLANIAGGIGKSAEEHVQWLDELLERRGEV